MFYLNGQTEAVDAPTMHNGHPTAPVEQREVTLLGFGVDHGRGAHAGNGNEWRTTVVAQVRLDYLKGQPESYVRLEGSRATELLAELAQAVAIRGRVDGNQEPAH